MPVPIAVIRPKIVVANGFVDHFNRPNDATALGAGWTTFLGTCGISSNQAYSAAGSSAAIHESNKANIRVQVTLAVVADFHGLVFRYVDAQNFWRLYFTDANTLLKLFKTVSNVTTEMGNVALAGNANDIIAVLTNGNSIKTYVNSTERHSITDSDLATATKHGMYLNAGVGRLDNFSAQGGIP